MKTTKLLWIAILLIFSTNAYSQTNKTLVCGIIKLKQTNHVLAVNKIYDKVPTQEQTIKDELQALIPLNLPGDIVITNRNPYISVPQNKISQFNKILRNQDASENHIVQISYWIVTCKSQAIVGDGKMLFFFPTKQVNVYILQTYLDQKLQNGELWSNQKTKLVKTIIKKIDWSKWYQPKYYKKMEQFLAPFFSITIFLRQNQFNIKQTKKTN